MSGMLSRGPFTVSLSVLATARFRERRHADCSEHHSPLTVGTSSNRSTQCGVVLDDFTAWALRGRSISSKTKQLRAESLPPPDETHTFVIVGDGMASRAAAQTIAALRPHDSTLLVLKESVRPAASLDTENSVVVLRDGTRVGFERCLLAYGAQHEPVPANGASSDFVDSMARPLVTALGRSAKDRVEFLSAARRGEPVCVIGSSWYAVDLATAAAEEARLHGLKAPSVFLVCPESAPLVRTLPRFLATSLVNRLAARGVAVKPFSAVRYIVPNHEDGDAGNQVRGSAEEVGRRRLRCDVYTCKTFDALDTERITGVARVAVADYLGSSPDALVRSLVVPPQPPTRASPLHALPRKDPALPPPSSFPSSSLEVHAGVGGVVVNAELQASSRVWACGDAVVFPHAGGLGRCRGAGLDHALHSGVAAARNMLAAEVSESAHSGAGAWLRAAPYTHAPVMRCESPSLGVALVTCGLCDSAAETHSFFWVNGEEDSASAGGSGSEGGGGRATPPGDSNPTTTTPSTTTTTSSGGSNQKNKKRYASPFYGGKFGPDQGAKSSTTCASAAPTTTLSPTATSPPLTRSEMRRKEDSRLFAQKLHGSGVVFYMDSTGERVVGVALWCTPGLYPSGNAQRLAKTAEGHPFRDAQQGNDDDELYARSLGVVRGLLLGAAGSPGDHDIAVASSAAAAAGAAAASAGGFQSEAWNGSSRGSSSDLERWYQLNPAEKERLKRQLDRRLRVEAMRAIAGEIALGAGRDPTAASSATASSARKRGTYRHAPAKQASGVLPPQRPAGLGVEGGRASFRDQRAAWVPSAAVGDFPFTSGRHGRSQSAQRQEAYSAGLSGDSSTAAGSWAQRLAFHPDARS